MNHWLKIEMETPDKPEIRTAARMCGVSKAKAFMAFFILWTYLDTHTATGFVPGLTLDDIDDIADLPGFGKAMAYVNWISQDAQGITVANWDRHNGKSAKKRALNQKRMQRERANIKWK